MLAWYVNDWHLGERAAENRFGTYRNPFRS